MLVSGGKILAIDQVYTDNETILGDGVQKPLGVNTDLIATNTTVSSVSSKLNQDINDVSGNFQNYYKKTETSAAEEISAAFENFKTNQTIVSAGSPNVTVEVVPSGDKTIIYKVEVQEGEINIAGTSGVSAKYDNGTWTIGLSADYLSANALEDYYKKQEVNDKFTETSAWANDTFQPSGNYLSANALDNYYTKASADATFQAKGNYVSADDFDEYKTQVSQEFANTSAWATDTFQAKGDYVSAKDFNDYKEEVTQEFNNTSAWALETFQLSGNYVSAKDFDEYKELVEQKFTNTSAWANDTFQEKGDYLSANALDDVSGAWNDVVHTVETYSAAWNEVSAYSATSGQFVTSSTESIEEGLANVLVKDENDNVTWSGVDLSKLGKIYGMSSQTPDLLAVGISADEDTQEPIYVLSAAKPGEVSVPGIAGYGLSAWKDTENDEYKVSAHIVGNHGVSAAYDAEANTWNVGISANDYSYLAGLYDKQAVLTEGDIIKYDSNNTQHIEIDEDGYFTLPDTGNKFTFCINESIENNITTSHDYKLNKIALIKVDTQTNAEEVIVTTHNYYPSEVGASDANITFTLSHLPNYKYAVKYLGSDILVTANLISKISIIEEITSLATTEGGGRTYGGVEPIWVDNDANLVGLAYDRTQFKTVTGVDEAHPELSALQIDIQTTGGNIDQEAFEKMANLIYGRLTETIPIGLVNSYESLGDGGAFSYLFRPTMEFDVNSGTNARIMTHNCSVNTSKAQVAISELDESNSNVTIMWWSEIKTLTAAAGTVTLTANPGCTATKTLYPDRLYYATVINRDQQTQYVGFKNEFLDDAGAYDIAYWDEHSTNNDHFAGDLPGSFNGLADRLGQTGGAKLKPYIAFRNEVQ